MKLVSLSLSLLLLMPGAVCASSSSFAVSSTQTSGESSPTLSHPFPADFLSSKMFVGRDESGDAPSFITLLNRMKADLKREKDSKVEDTERFTEERKQLLASEVVRATIKNMYPQWSDDSIAEVPSRRTADECVFISPKGYLNATVPHGLGYIAYGMIRVGEWCVPACGLTTDTEDSTAWITQQFNKHADDRQLLAALPSMIQEIQALQRALAWPKETVEKFQDRLASGIMQSVWPSNIKEGEIATSLMNLFVKLQAKSTESGDHAQWLLERYLYHAMVNKVKLRLPSHKVLTLPDTAFLSGIIAPLQDKGIMLSQARKALWGDQEKNVARLNRHYTSYFKSLMRSSDQGNHSLMACLLYNTTDMVLNSWKRIQAPDSGVLVTLTTEEAAERYAQHVAALQEQAAQFASVSESVENDLSDGSDSSDDEEPCGAPGDCHLM